MEIVDTQVHLNHFGTHWDTVDHDALIDYSIVMMDALGVDTVLIDEWAGWDDQLRHLPGYPLENGAMRSRLPFSERAMQLHPDRFGYVSRIDPRDPDMDRLMAEVRTRPGGLCLRIVAFPETGDLDRFVNGGFDALLAAAQQYGVPIFCWFPGRAHLLAPKLQQFPNLQLILDHCGVDSTCQNERAERIVHLEQVLELAIHPNLAIKWCHAPNEFSVEPYPFRDVMPLLRRLIDAFSPRRLMWASDHTQSKDHHSWAEALYYLLDSPELSEDEKTWILGRTARSVLRWPPPSSRAQPA